MMRDKPGVLLEKARYKVPGFVHEPGTFNGAFQLKNLRIISSDGLIWRDVTGYEGIYSVSNTGLVIAHERTVMLPRNGYRLQPESILAQEQMKKGYRRVTLNSHGQREMNKVLVHVLVAAAFIDNPDPLVYTQVNHRDGVKANNCASNLEWCTPDYNRWHAFDLGLRDGEYHGEPPLPPIRCSDSFAPWEHVSVSTPIRCPTWDEMCFVKSLFWDDEETVMQLHPPKSQWVSNHPYCLHLWKPPVPIPLPDALMVGIKDDGEYKNRDEARAGYLRAVARGDLGKYLDP